MTHYGITPWDTAVSHAKALKAQLLAIRHLPVSLCTLLFSADAIVMSVLPVFVVDEHDEALAAQHAALGAGRCPPSGLVLEHFDAHPDLTVPSAIDGALATDLARRAEVYTDIAALLPHS